MNLIVEQIRNAYRQGNFLPALALALTIPDVCGGSVSPGIKNVGKRYRDWFDKWALPSFVDHTGFDADGQPNRAYFDGEMCYRLRCRFLHENSPEIRPTSYDEEPGTDYQYFFELAVNGTDSYGETWSSTMQDGMLPPRIRRVRIDIGALCEALCSAAERFLMESQDLDLRTPGLIYFDLAVLPNA